MTAIYKHLEQKGITNISDAVQYLINKGFIVWSMNYHAEIYQTYQELMNQGMTSGEAKDQCAVLYQKSISQIYRIVKAMKAT